MKIKIGNIDYSSLIFIDVPKNISVFELKQKVLKEKGIYVEEIIYNGILLMIMIL